MLQEQTVSFNSYEVLVFLKIKNTLFSLKTLFRLKFEANCVILVSKF